MVQKISEKLDILSQELDLVQPGRILEGDIANIQERLDSARAAEAKILVEMIFLQEELDWYVYALYGLTNGALCYQGVLTEIKLGQRAFEISLARSVALGESETIWFEHHDSVSILEIPSQWPADYQALVQKRLSEIENNHWVNLIDNKDHKRRWSRDSWGIRLQAELKEWLLGRLEQTCKT